MSFSTRLVFVAVALLTAPIASRGQTGDCDLPTQGDVESAGGEYLTDLSSEGGAAITMTVHAMHFTCLARVAFDKYSYASVVVNATSSDEPGTTQAYQFQLQCSSSNDWDPHDGSLFDANVPSDPLSIETDLRCSECAGLPSNTANYNATTNCRKCNPACGNQFCTSGGTSGCCSGFSSDTGECVDCTTIDPNFGPNEDFVCVCQISCDPGHTPNYTDCSCKLTDGCEAAGQPCRNGSCTSDVSAEPPYSCMCNAGYTGENCSSVIPTVAITHPTSATTAEIPECDGCVEGQCSSVNTGNCCSECIEQYMLAEDNCTCELVPATEPTRDTGPTCPSECRDCSVDDPTCCTVCIEGYELRSCDCVEVDDGERSLAASQVAGIAIGLLLFILLILALAVLLAYVIYYFYDNKQKLKKGTALSPFSNGESHSNPLYLTPEEVDDQ